MTFSVISNDIFNVLSILLILSLPVYLSSLFLKDYFSFMHIGIKYERNMHIFGTIEIEQNLLKASRDIYRSLTCHFRVISQGNHERNDTRRILETWWKLESSAGKLKLNIRRVRYLSKIKLFNTF